MWMEVRLEQPLNAPFMDVTLSGIMMEVRLEQPENAPTMDVTLSGMLMEVRLEQPEYLQVFFYQFFISKTVEK